MKLKKWLNKGEGGEWFEPYITNSDIVFLFIMSSIVGGIIITGCWLTTKF